MTPAYVRIRIGGRSHTRLRTQIDNHLHSLRFYKMRRGRMLVNHFIRTSLTARECAELVSALYTISHAFGPGAEIKELLIVSFPNIQIHLYS
jgi:hypothetical protein